MHLGRDQMPVRQQVAAYIIPRSIDIQVYRQAVTDNGVMVYIMPGNSGTKFYRGRIYASHRQQQQ